MAEWFVAKAAEMADGDRRIVAAGLQYEDLDARVFGQPVSDNAAGRAGADNDVVKGLGHGVFGSG